MARAVTMFSLCRMTAQTSLPPARVGRHSDGANESLPLDGD